MTQVVIASRLSDGIVVFLKETATRGSAGAAVSGGQHGLDVVDAGIFVNVQGLAGDGEDDGKTDPKSRHEQPGRDQCSEHFFLFF